MEQGKCPKCGEFNFAYSGREADDDQVGYLCICLTCGYQGVEWYRLEFIEYADRT